MKEIFIYLYSYIYLFTIDSKKTRKKEQNASLFILLWCVGWNGAKYVDRRLDILKYLRNNSFHQYISVYIGLVLLKPQID